MVYLTLSKTKLPIKGKSQFVMLDTSLISHKSCFFSCCNSNCLIQQSLKTIYREEKDLQLPMSELNELFGPDYHYLANLQAFQSS